MTNDQLNAEILDVAAFRRRWDLGLRWAGLMLACPIWPAAGCLILRRWTGMAGERGDNPAAVGFAIRPATQVSSDAGAVYANNTVYWQDVDVVSGGGVLTPATPGSERARAWGASGDVGALPNTPVHVRARQVEDGKVHLTWSYNGLYEQVTPARFDVFSDGGTGTMNWSTVVDQIAYDANRPHYGWLSDAQVDGTLIEYSVRARSATGVYSLIPAVADKHLGSSPTYGSGRGVPTLVRIKTLASPTAPRFL